MLDTRERLTVCHQCRAQPAGCWRLDAPKEPRKRLQAGAIAATEGRCPLGKWGEPPPPSAQGPAWLVQPARGPIDVVYFLGPESKHGDWELRYSLRSVAKNFLDLGLVIVVGHRPKWLTGVVHIPMPDKHKHNKDANLIEKLVAAQRWGATPWFLNVSDDQIILKPLHFSDCRAFYALDLAQAKPSFWGPHRWKDRLKRTMNHLVSHGLPAFHHDCHVPFPIHGETFARVAAGCDYARVPGFTVHTLYANSAAIERTKLRYGVKATYEHACRVRRNIAGELDRATFLGYSDAGMTPEFMAEVESRFPEPSRFEADVPIVPAMIGRRRLHLPDVKTVVYTTDRPSGRARQPRIAAMLDGMGFRDWSFFRGRIGRPYWKMIRPEYAALLRDNEPPFLILEDDIAVYDYSPWVDSPPQATVVYLGGGGAWRGGKMIREAQQRLPHVPIRRVRNIGLADIDADWVRPFGMFSTHAILYLDEATMLAMADTIERDTVQVDVIFGKNQWRWNCALLRSPMWFQQDGHNDRGTIEYCLP